MTLPILDIIKYAAPIIGIAAASFGLYRQLYVEPEPIAVGGIAVSLSGGVLHVELYHENLRNDCVVTTRNVSLISAEKKRRYVVFSLDATMKQGNYGMVANTFDATISQGIVRGVYAAHAIEVYRCGMTYFPYEYPSRNIYVAD